MAAKTEAKEGAPPAAPTSTAAPASPAAASAGRGGLRAWIPALVVVIAAPAASWAVTQFVLVPSMQKKLTASLAAVDAAGQPGGEKASKAGPAAPQTYAFENVVVNLAGTMGTRYLKTSFLVTGSVDGMHGLFEEKKAQLMDVTLNVLSSLTMSDLEEPGSKNVLREKLVAAYNQTFGKKVAEQVYFSDFVVQ